MKKILIIVSILYASKVPFEVEFKGLTPMKTMATLLVLDGTMIKVYHKDSIGCKAIGAELNTYKIKK